MTGLIIGFACFLGWKFYQNTTREFIPLSALENVELTKENGQLILKGQAEIGNFEMVRNYGAIQIESDIYIYITKTKAIIGNKKVYENINSIVSGDTAIEAKHYYLISGQKILVKNEDSKKNYIEVRNYSEIRELIPREH